MLRSLVALAVAATLVVAASPDASARSHRSNAPTPEATATRSPTPSASSSAQPSPSDPFPEPDKPGFFDLVGKVRYAISQWFSNLVTSALRPVFDFLGRTGATGSAVRRQAARRRRPTPRIRCYPARGGLDGEDRASSRRDRGVADRASRRRRGGRRPFRCRSCGRHLRGGRRPVPRLPHRDPPAVVVPGNLRDRGAEPPPSGEATSPRLARRFLPAPNRHPGRFSTGTPHGLHRSPRDGRGGSLAFVGVPASRDGLPKGLGAQGERRWPLLNPTRGPAQARSTWIAPKRA